MTLTIRISVGGNYVAEVRGQNGARQDVGPNEQDAYVSMPGPLTITERPATALEVRVAQQGAEIAELKRRQAAERAEAVAVERAERN